MSLCINCPEELQVEASYKYNQLAPMCEEHFNKVVEAVEAICKSVVDRNRYKIK